MFVVSQEGAQQALSRLVGATTFNTPWEIHLMGTAGAPVHAWTLANYVALELPLANGYNVQTLVPAGADWAITPVASGGLATSIVLSWTFTAALTVYGWFARDPGSGLSWGGEEFSPAFVFPAGGGLFTWKLPLNLVSCPGVSAC